MAALVLIVEDEKIQAESMSIYLDRQGYSSVFALSGEEGLRRAEEASPDVAIVDLRLPGMGGLDVLSRLREITPGSEVIMLTAHGTVGSAVEAMRRGAFDYLSKPVDFDELRVVVDKALTHLRLRRELSYLKARDGAATGGEIVGESAPVRALRADVARIATLEAAEGIAPTVLLLGETGTGKGLVARALHHQSPRLRSVRRHQLRGHSARVARGRALRLRARRVYRCQERQAGPVRSGRGWHHLSRRDRSHGPGAPDQAAQGHRRPDGPATGKPEAQGGQGSHRDRHQSRSGSGGGRGCVPPGPLFPHQGPDARATTLAGARQRRAPPGPALPRRSGPSR